MNSDSVTGMKIQTWKFILFDMQEVWLLVRPGDLTIPGAAHRAPASDNRSMALSAD